MNLQSIGHNIKEKQRDIDVSGSMFRTRIFLISELIDMLESGKLELIGGKPFKQWTKSLKCRVIENLLIGLPPGGIVVDATGPTWYVVDGAEMLDAFRQFFNNRFSLDQVNFNSELYAGKTFSGENRLSLMMHRRLTNAQIVTTIADAKSSYVTRLWLYDFFLSRNGRGGKLWDCVGAVMPVKFSELEVFAADRGIKDLRLLWDVIFAASFFYTLSDEDIDNWEPKEAARFVMFEYLCMSHIHEMLKVATPNFSSSEDFLTCLVDKIKSEIPEDFGEKQRICYAIVQTLVAVHHRKMPSDSFRKLFDKAWKKNKNIGRGRLDRDYIQKIRALYYTINK